MRAMRLATGFFATLSNMHLHERVDAFCIEPESSWPWYFFRKKQLFLVFQDPTHIVTKWRNRLLSHTARLVIGKYSVSIDHLNSIYNNEKYSKLDHKLTKSDLNPKDRQNYHSCTKIASDDLLNIVQTDRTMKGTLIYLKMLQLLITAYIERSTDIATRK